MMYSDSSYSAACHNIDQWPPPEAGHTLQLPLMGSVVQVGIEMLHWEIKASCVAWEIWPSSKQGFTVISTSWNAHYDCIIQDGFGGRGNDPGPESKWQSCIALVHSCVVNHILFNILECSMAGHFDLSCSILVRCFGEQTMSKNMHCTTLCTFVHYTTPFADRVLCIIVQESSAVTSKHDVQTWTCRTNFFLYVTMRVV